MPLTRYQIRNEYSLADPELYRAADKDDPEALLEGVAMAGLVGVLRQLGDLAEFAAEIFHDLHEEVMATAARGHGLMVRVQQLEAEVPSIEKAFLSQTNHSLFFTNAGVDWHPNLRTEHNLITRGDLPRCVLDSYEECRGPPRLFLLDKFDVAGAGACLKRYTDPSFFKAESAFPETVPVETQREKKARKVKKKGSRWRNGETPEIAPTSHSKLHQLFLEERIENAYNNPARLVKLKRRQLNESPLDPKSGKSYMEKFLESPSPEHKAVYETSSTPPLLTLALDNSSESGLEIVEISTVSPVKSSSEGKEKSSSLPNAQEVLKSPVDELNGEVIDREIVKVPEPTSNFTDRISPHLRSATIEKNIIVDGEGRNRCSIDEDHSDDMTSEVDNYMDALTTMESEMDTDNEYKPKNNFGFINIGKCPTDSDANEENLEVQAHSSDSQSLGVSSASEDGNSSFKKGRSSFSCSDTIDNLAEDLPSDGEVADKALPANKNCVAEIVEAPSIQHPACYEMQSSSSDDTKDTFSGDCRLPDHGEASSSSCLEDLNPTHVLLDPTASSMAVSLREPQLDEVPYDGVKTNSNLSERDDGKYLVDSSEVISADSSEKQKVTSITMSAESHPVNELDSGDINVSSDALPQSSNIFKLAPEKSSGDPLDEVLETEYTGETHADDSVNEVINSPKSIISPSEENLPCSTLAEVERSSGITRSPEVMKPVNLTSEVNDATSEAGVNSECTSPMVDTSQNCDLKEKQFSDILHDDPQCEAGSTEVGASYSEQKQNVDPQCEAGSTEVGASYSEQKQNVDELFEATDGEDTGKIANVVEDVISCDLPSYSADKLDLNNGIDDSETEIVPTETIAVSTAACDSADFDDVQSSNSICSPSGNLTNLQEPLSDAGNLRQEGLESNEVISQVPVESKPQEETNQVECTPADIDSTSCKLVSYGNSDLEDDVSNSSLAEPTKNSLNFGDLITVPASSELSDQVSESEYSSHLMESRDDVVSSPTACYISEKDTSLEQSLYLHTDQHDDRSLDIVEDHSSSLNLQSDQIQSLDHINQERCLQASSEHSIEASSSQPPLEFLQQSGSQDEQEMNPSDRKQPAINLLHEGKVSMEEMPPLPPLPPMQWRMGRVQHSSPGSQRELVEHGRGSFPFIPQFAVEQKSQFGVPELEMRIEQPRNPFLPLVEGEERPGHVSDQLATDFVLHSPFPMDPPTMGNNNANSQFNGILLDRTQPNPFLALPVVSNESHEYGSNAMEDDRVESSCSVLPMPATEYANSGHIPVSLPEKTSNAPDQLLLDSGLEGEAFQHPKQTSEGECRNPSSISMPTPTKREEQSPSMVVEELPTKVEEQLPANVDKQPQHDLAATEAANVTVQHVLAAPEGETTQTSKTSLQYELSTSGEGTPWPSNTLALLPVVEDGSTNGNPTVKIPRPRNPLIDAVAAHDRSKLRKVSERVRPPIIPKVEERDSLLEQIRTKSFSLKPAAVSRPSIQGPKTNLRVAAILEKANAIRQALAGSDEDDDEDGWSDS